MNWLLFFLWLMVTPKKSKWWLNPDSNSRWRDRVKMHPVSQVFFAYFRKFFVPLLNRYREWKNVPFDRWTLWEKRFFLSQEDGEKKINCRWHKKLLQLPKMSFLLDFLITLNFFHKLLCQVLIHSADPQSRQVVLIIFITSVLIRYQFWKSCKTKHS